MLPALAACTLLAVSAPVSSAKPTKAHAATIRTSLNKLAASIGALKSEVKNIKDVNSGQTGEDVKTGKADKNRKKSSEDEFGRRNPHLGAAGKTPHDQAVGGHADQSQSKQPNAQVGAPIVLQFVDDAAGKF